MAKGDFQRRATEWLRGRNGSDDLTRVTSNLALVLLVIELFARTGWLSWFALGLIAYSWWRISSKKIEARAIENEVFMSRLGPVRPWVASPKAAFAEVRAYKHLKCPSCGQVVRVPRGKGKLRVTCPTCHNKFDAKA